MIGLIEQLGKLGSQMDIHFNTDLTLQSLPASLSVFIKNYDMGGIVKPLNELHYMVEEFVRRVPEILVLNKESEIVMKEQRQRQEQGKGQEQSSSWEQEHVQTSKSFYTNCRHGLFPLQWQMVFQT